MDASMALLQGGTTSRTTRAPAKSLVCLLKEVGVCAYRGWCRHYLSLYLIWFLMQNAISIRNDKDQRRVLSSSSFFHGTPGWHAKPERQRLAVGTEKTLRERSKQVEFLFCHGSREWGRLLLLLGGLENGSGMVSWFVVSEVCWSLLKVEAKLLQIFHRETPVIATVPAAKADHGSFRCKAGVNTSSLESIIMLSVNLWNHSVSEGSSQTWAWTSDAPRRGKQQLS